MSEIEGWNQYGKLILKELERLNENYESLRKGNDMKFDEMTKEIGSLKSMEEKIYRFDEWKSRVDDIMSPSQMKDLRDEVSLQKTKWTFMYAIVAAIQVISGLVMFAIGYFKK